jgi:hypothetical protein
MVLWLGASAYIDIGLALFVTMGIYSFLNWGHLKEKKWLILGALFLGFSAGSKYPALFFLILFAFVAVYIGLKDRKLLHTLIFLLIAAGVASPWYFRNWYYTGNPVFPFLSDIFGYSFWNAMDIQGALNDLIHAHGAGKSVQSLLLLPWNLAFNQPKFLMEAHFSHIYLFTLPLLLLSLAHSKIRELFIVVLSYLLFWFETAQVLRYLIPIIPLLSLITAASIEHCLGFIFPKRPEGLKKGILTLAVSMALFSPGWLYAFHRLQNEDYPPCTKEEQAYYLTEKLPSFPAYQYLNQTRGRNYSLYALFDENMAYFADGRFMGDWFGPGRFERIYSKFSNVKALHQELRSLGANYFLIRRGRVPIEPPPEDFFSPSYFKLIMKNHHFVLFEVLK